MTKIFDILFKVRYNPDEHGLTLDEAEQELTDWLNEATGQDEELPNVLGFLSEPSDYEENLVVKTRNVFRAELRKKLGLTQTKENK